MAVYSFSGENEQFTVSNGVIVLTDTEEIFYVGNLKGKPGQLPVIAAFSATFYVMSDNGKEILLSNSVEDQTGQAINISGLTDGKLSGDIIPVSKTNIGELQDNFYFELQTTNLNGKKMSICCN